MVIEVAPGREQLDGLEPGAANLLQVRRLEGAVVVQVRADPETDDLSVT